MKRSVELATFYETLRSKLKQVLPSFPNLTLDVVWAEFKLRTASSPHSAESEMNDLIWEICNNKWPKKGRLKHL